jgi:hypothetical protein
MSSEDRTLYTPYGSIRLTPNKLGLLTAGIMYSVFAPDMSYAGGLFDARSVVTVVNELIVKAISDKLVAKPYTSH